LCPLPTPDVNPRFLFYCPGVSPKRRFQVFRGLWPASLAPQPDFFVPLPPTVTLGRPPSLPFPFFFQWLLPFSLYLHTFPSLYPRFGRLGCDRSRLPLVDWTSSLGHEFSTFLRSQVFFFYLRSETLVCASKILGFFGLCYDLGLTLPLPCAPFVVFFRTPSFFFFLCTLGPAGPSHPLPFFFHCLLFVSRNSFAFWPAIPSTSFFFVRGRVPDALFSRHIGDCCSRSLGHFFSIPGFFFVAQS